MLVGFCPNCGSVVVEVYNLDWKGEVSLKTYKREKAIKIYEKLEPSITGDYYGNIKYGTKANMGFCYGDNREIHDTKGNIVEIRRYAVDFNGTKELRETIKIG